MEASDPERIAIAAEGDFVGTGVWKFVERGNAANHAWAMARGLENLELELIRRRATAPHELARTAGH